MSAVLGVLGATHIAAPANSSALFSGVDALNRVGCTEHFEVFYDRLLGESGRTAGSVVLNRAERDLEAVRVWFGGLTLPKERFVVALARLPEDARTFRKVGAPLEDAVIFSDVQTTPRLEPFQSSYFVTFQVASMFAAAAGWGSEKGDALARVLATALYPQRVAGFATAWLWLQSDRDDLVGVPMASGAESTGCAVLFLNYLHHQLGFSWQEIAQQPAPTLAALAGRLTQADDEFARFRLLLDEHLPAGQPAAAATDNPFPLIDTTGAAISDRTVRAGRRTGGRTERPTRRVCLLTGASGTLGSYLCDRETERYEFAGVYRKRPPPPGIFAIEADLTLEGECERAVEAALTRFGRIDVVINAVVASTWRPMLESEVLPNSAASQLVTNVAVPFRVSCAAARLAWRDHIEENRAANRNVINMSSISGQNLFAGEGQSVYAASKAALDHLTGHMALEFAAIGVRVNAVAPNSFPSNVATERVAAAISRLDEGDMTGGLVVVDGSADRMIQLT